MCRDLRAHLGADASDVHVDGARTAAVLKAPHAVQQHLAAVSTVGMRRQKAQQRVFHQRQVDGLVIERHLVGCQVNLEVVDVEHIVGGDSLLLAHQALRASLELVGRRRGAYKVGMRVIRQAQGAECLVIDDHQHGNAAAIVKPLGNLIDAVTADAIGIEDQQVKVVRQGDRLGSYVFEVGASQRGNGCIYDRKYSAINMAKRDVFNWDEILKGIDVFYFSGVTPAVSDEMAAACKDALAACRAKGITTVCDVNYRGKMWSPEKSQATMRELLPLVDICIANDEDAPAGLGMTCVSGSLAHGIEERDTYVEMARQICAEYGCKKVASVVRNISCVERSIWMGMLFDAESGEHWFSPAHDVHVLEGVAAGDAFNAGLVHALINDFDPQAAVNYAIAASILKLTIKGDSNLVTADEIAAVASAADGGTRVAR